MNRAKFMSSEGKDGPNAKFLKYREACRVMAEMHRNKEVLNYMGEVFGEVEDKINRVVIGLAPHELVYERKGDSAQAFTHNGAKMQVSFKLRNMNTSLVYEVTLGLGDIFELTDQDLIARIRGLLIRPNLRG